MAISMSKYVSIVSGVGGESVASQKDMILRVFTTNVLAPFNRVLEFSGDAASALKAVGNYFGTTSNEYAIASKYFAWVSPKITTATKISYARYALEGAKPSLIPSTDKASLAELKEITNGSMVINLGETAYELSGLDFSSAVALADVASVIQTAIRANTEGGELFTGAEVSYVANYGFELFGGVVGNNAIGYAEQASGGDDVSALLGWDEASQPILSEGSAVETVVSALDRVAEISNNFASFMFVEALEQEDIVSVATWTVAQNYSYVYNVPCNASNYASLSSALYDKACVSLVYEDADEWAEIIPAIITAATPYGRVNGVIGQMYRQFPEFTPSVTTDATAGVLDPLRVNYVGQTQKAGQNISFFQDGFDMNGIQLNVVYGEIYVKDAITTAALNLLVAVDSPASKVGDAMFRAVVIPEIEACKTNGIISTGKPFTTIQQAYIDNLTGEEGSWRTVQNNGYILQSEVKMYNTDGTTKYKWSYVLIYSKGDLIIKVEGSDILI